METNEIKQPTVRQVRDKAFEYAESTTKNMDYDHFKKYCRDDFIEGAEWFRQQIILLNKESEGTK